MKKLLIKTTISFITMISIAGAFTPLSLSARAEANSSDDIRSNYQNTMEEAAEQLSTYFELDENGNVLFNVDKDTLVKELVKKRPYLC